VKGGNFDSKGTGDGTLKFYHEDCKRTATGVFVNCCLFGQGKETVATLGWLKTQDGELIEKGHTKTLREGYFERGKLITMTKLLMVAVRQKSGEPKQIQITEYWEGEVRVNDLRQKVRSFVAAHIFYPHGQCTRTYFDKEGNRTSSQLSTW
jgi:hypothetical protein